MAARVTEFGFSTVQARDLSNLDEILGRISATGATCAELSLLGSDLVCGGRLLPKAVDKLRQICLRHALRYTVHGPLSADFMTRATRDHHLAAVAAILEIAGLVGASVVVQHAGRPEVTDPLLIETLHGEERDCLRRLGDVAARHGVLLAVENLWVASPGQYTAAPERLAQEIQKVDHPSVAGTLDLSHAYLQTSWLGTDFQAAAIAFAPVAGHLHIHDSFGRPGDFYRIASEQLAYGIGDLHLPLGWGDIPWETLLPKLAVRPGSIFMIELPPPYWDEMAACAEAARRLMPLVGRDCAAAA
jgi:sugar phosphate isomerase/epimerase